MEAFRAAALQALELERQHEASLLQARPRRLTNLYISHVAWGLSGKPLVTLTHPGDVDLPLLETGTCFSLCVANEAGAVACPCVVVANEPLRVSLSVPLKPSLGAAHILTQVPDETTYKRVEKALGSLAETATWPVLLFSSLSVPPASPTPAPPVEALFDSTLNAGQRLALAEAVGGPLAVAVHGPPGTGKSQTLVEVVRQLHTRGKQVLVCAPSNVAVDNILLRLAGAQLDLARAGHPSRVDARVLPWCLEYADPLGLSAELASAPNFSEARRLKAELKAREAQWLRERLRGADVVLSTMAGAAKLRGRLRPGFALLVDEAAQASAAALFVPLALEPSRLVVFGDHCQLGPTVKAPGAGALEESAMDLVMKTRRACLLNVQYRMHPIIMQWASDASYEGRLECGVGEATPNESSSSMLLLDVPLGRERADADGSFYNAAEAAAVQTHVEWLLREMKASDVAVISPYRAQVAVLKRLMPPGVDVRSVDGFQGQERRAVVVSCVRSQGQLGFLVDRRRINVAITRAKSHVCVVGSRGTLCRDAFLKGLVEYIERVGQVRVLDDIDEVDVPANVLSVSGEKKQQQQQEGKKKKKKSQQKSEARGILPESAVPVEASHRKMEPVKQRNEFTDLVEDRNGDSQGEEEEQSTAQEQSEAAADVLPIAPTLRTTPAKPKPAPALVTVTIDNNDDDAFLDEALRQARTCAHEPCSSSVSVLGLNCRLCKGRFCVKHQLPEVHGCSKGAADRAKTAVPSIKPSEKAKLKDKLHAKIAAEEQNRSKKKS